jgi:hypothetical protein
MIEFIFTIDYEIYGNGQGTLKESVYEPAEKFNYILQQHNGKCVTFVEVAELEMIEAYNSDPDIDLIKQQLRDFHAQGIELGLHFHPWWYNAHYENNHWILDYSEYNVCVLPRERIVKLVNRSIDYFNKLLGDDNFIPISYRAGHLIFQPSKVLATILSEKGLKIDSSVYKGGLWHKHKLDYRPAIRNGYYWRFKDDVNINDSQGVLLEVPIYTQMVPTWKMFTAKRISMQGFDSSVKQTGKKMLNRLKDRLRLFQPLKLDFCQMTIEELKRIIDSVILDDEKTPALFKPVVAIGHTKELVDLKTVESFLTYLDKKKIPISTFKDAYNKCN